jgi:hypothetical protein
LKARSALIANELALQQAAFRLVRADTAFQEVKKAGLLAELSGVEVDVSGADAAGKSAGEWESLRRFWTSYFKAANGDLRAYALLREPLGF